MQEGLQARDHVNDIQRGYRGVVWWGGVGKPVVKGATRTTEVSQPTGSLSVCLNNSMETPRAQMFL